MNKNNIDETNLSFDGTTDLQTFLNQQKGYLCQESKHGFPEVLFRGEFVGFILKRSKLYKFLASHGVSWSRIISEKLLPDDSIYIKSNDYLFIIEQPSSEATEEKLQTCNFKIKQYKKLMATLQIEVKYIYLLPAQFKHKKYKDILEYVENVGCCYHFETISLSAFGLPS